MNVTLKERQRLRKVYFAFSIYLYTREKKRNTIKLRAFIIIFFSYHESYRNFNYQENPESRLTNKFPHDGTNIFQFFFSLLFFFCSAVFEIETKKADLIWKCLKIDIFFFLFSLTNPIESTATCIGGKRYFLICQ